MTVINKEFALLWNKFGFDFYGSDKPVIKAMKKYFDKLETEPSGNYIMFYNNNISLKYTAIRMLIVNIMIEKGFCDYGISPRVAFTTEEGTKFVNYFKEHTVNEIYNFIFGDEYADIFTEVLE